MPYFNLSDIFKKLEDGDGPIPPFLPSPQFYYITVSTLGASPVHQIKPLNDILTKIAARDCTSLLQHQAPQIDISVNILEAALEDHFEPLSDILKRIADGNCPGPNVTMRYELLRLCTFQNYPRHNKPFLIRLAGAGFYFAGVEDEVICYCCGVRKQGWIAADKPADVHKRLSSNCRFIRRNNEVNIPVRNVANFNPEKFAFIDSIPDVSSDMYPQPTAEDAAGSNYLEDTSRPGVPRPLGQVAVPRPITNSDVGQMPKHPQYATKATRLASFNGWPDNVKQSPEVPSDAGFYYAGFGDCVRCFFCSTGLKLWEEEDNAFIEHARWSRNCFYLKQKKGQEFINLVSLAVQYTEGDQQPSGSADEALRRNEIGQILLSDAAQSVLEMGYDSRIIKLAIERLFSTIGRNELTATKLMEKVLEIEDEENTAAATTGMSQISESNETAREDSVSSGNSVPRQGVATSEKSKCSNSGTSGASASAASRGGAKGGTEDSGPSSFSRERAVKKRRSSYRADQNVRQSMDSSTAQALEWMGCTKESISDAILKLNNQGNENMSAEQAYRYLMDERVANDTDPLESSAARALLENNTGYSTQRIRESIMELRLVTGTNDVSAEMLLRYMTGEDSARENQSLRMKVEKLKDMAKEDLQNYQELQNEVDKSKDLMTCRICLDKQRRIVFLPCGHFLCCVECATKVNRCPMCRGRIESFVNTFQS